jgi:glycine cleavage system H lipoate-binding protein
LAISKTLPLISADKRGSGWIAKIARIAKMARIEQWQRQKKEKATAIANG